VRDSWSLLKQTAFAWSGHEAARLSAALSFYGLLSLAPLIILVVAIAALVFGHTGAQEAIVRQFAAILGVDGAKAIAAVIEHGKNRAGVVATVLGLLTLLVGASGVFSELQTALNRIWEVPPAARPLVHDLIRTRLFSFGLALGVGFLMLVSLIVSAGLAALGTYFGELLPVPAALLEAINFLVSFAGVSLLFALIFKYVPDVNIAWYEVWQGAIATALLFTIGKWLIGLYLGTAAVGSAYGAAGSLIVVIVWVYYSSLIFLFGAEFTHTRAVRRASRRAARAAAAHAATTRRE
jgi:membrane protein